MQMLVRLVVALVIAALLLIVLVVALAIQVIKMLAELEGAAAEQTASESESIRH